MGLLEAHSVFVVMGVTSCFHTVAEQVALL